MPGLFADDSRHVERKRASDALFQDFWQAYPKKVARVAAVKAWGSIRPTEALLQTILAALEWQREEWDDLKYAPHPSTYLNQQRWTDEPTGGKVEKPNQTKAFEHWQKKVAGELKPWLCPHLDVCAHQSMCQHKLAMPQKYPVREETV